MTRCMLGCGQSLPVRTGQIHSGELKLNLTGLGLCSKSAQRAWDARSLRRPWGAQRAQRTTVRWLLNRGWEGRGSKGAGRALLTAVSREQEKEGEDEKRQGQVQPAGLISWTEFVSLLHSSFQKNFTKHQRPARQTEIWGDMVVILTRHLLWSHLEERGSSNREINSKIIYGREMLCGK